MWDGAARLFAEGFVLDADSSGGRTGTVGAGMSLLFSTVPKLNSEVIGSEATRVPSLLALDSGPVTTDSEDSLLFCLPDSAISVEG